jgi:NADH-quinone oxidoreductase subunit H
MTGWLSASNKAAFALLVFPGFAFLFIWAMAFRWIDRRVIARLEGRIGPPWFQPLADFIKLMAKEDILPLGTDEVVATILPIISLAAVMTAASTFP